MSQKEAFSAGQTREFYGDGDFFRLLETTAGINVEFFYQGREVAEMIDVQAGYAESFARDKLRFDRIRIYSATAQNVKWVIREGSDVRYDRGAATITGTVDLSAATLLAMEQINVRPEAPTAFLTSTAALAALTAETFFTPAQNPNGAIVLAAGFSTIGASNDGACFIAHTAAPATFATGDMILGSHRVLSGSAQGDVGVLQLPQFVPAGKGLYFLTGAAIGAGNANNRYARWRAL